MKGGVPIMTRGIDKSQKRNKSAEMPPYKRRSEMSVPHAARTFLRGIKRRPPSAVQGKKKQAESGSAAAPIVELRLFFSQPPLSAD